jgi:hypothetical protein
MNDRSWHWRNLAAGPPPATEVEVEVAEGEHKRSFPLQPFLRRLYTGVSNGGWDQAQARAASLRRNQLERAAAERGAPAVAHIL